MVKDFITLVRFAFPVRISLDFSELIMKFHTFLLFCYQNLFLILCKTRVLFPPAKQYSLWPKFVIIYEFNTPEKMKTDIVLLLCQGSCRRHKLLLVLCLFVFFIFCVLLDCKVEFQVFHMKMLEYTSIWVIFIIWKSQEFKKEPFKHTLFWGKTSDLTL